MPAKKAPAKAKPAAKKAAPTGDANDHYNHGLRLMMSIEGELREGTALVSSASIVEEAEASLELALELASNHGRAHIMLGNLYRYTGRPKLGVPHFDYATGLPAGSDDWIKAIDGLASCHMLLDADAPAIKALTLGIKHAPNEALFHYKLGAIYVDDGKTANAKKALQRVLELDPSHGPAQELLAQIGGGAPAPKLTGDQAALQKKTEKLAKDLQDKMMKLMSGPGSAEDKIKKSQKLQEEFQKAVQKLYGQ